MSTSGEPRPQDLAARVEALERTVASLEARLASLGAGQADSPPATFDAAATQSPQPPPAGPSFTGAPVRPALPRDDAFSASLPPAPPRGTASADPGQWAGRLGIALLLLGAAFGFKYSIDRGWIGPSTRVACGFALGVALVALSARIRDSRRGLSRVLAGGGIGAAYLSAYAAYAFYGLVPHAVAFATMSAVTGFAWTLAVRDSDAAVATLATAVGLATPFLLMTGSGSVAGLVMYTTLVVAGAAAVFARRGWPVLLWTTAVGAWTVLALAASQAAGGAATGAAAVEAGVAFVAAATWGLAVARELRGEARDEPGTDREQVHQLALGTPVAAMFVTGSAWTLGDTGAGLVAAALGAAWAAIAVWIRARGAQRAVELAATHAAGAAVMLAFAMWWLLGHDASRVGLAAEALALLFVASRTRGRWPATIGHLLYLLVVRQTLPRLLDGLDGASSTFGLAELSDLAVIASLAAGAVVAPVHSAALLGVAAQAGLLAWLQMVLAPTSGGDQLVTASWFANAVVVVVAGLRVDSDTLRRMGAVVMALTMGKLFVHDLASADPFWRIVVFGGFGVVLLALGYAFPALWKKRDVR